MIAAGSVYKISDTDRVIRLIHIDSEAIFYIELYKKLVAPKVCLLDFLKKQIEEYNYVEMNDPYQRIILEESLSQKEKEKRDYQFNIVNKYWEQNKNDLLNIKNRNATFKYIAVNEDVPIATIRRMFSRFWQRGLNKNAMLPDYNNSGARGESKEYKTKTGRPRTYSFHGEKIGCNVDDVVRRQFEAAYKKYYLNKQGKSLREVYRWVLSEYYSVQIDSNEKSEKFLVKKANIPTWGQFYYWYKKNHDKKIEIIKRKGEKEYELKNRPITSSSILETTGPGYRFQVDATTADIYLVSEVNRNKTVGRPTIYVIIDVFSRMITGLYVGWEYPSWNGAMMVLNNMVSNKVEFCRKNDIKISEDEWPCEHIPESIIADRGEFESTRPEDLVNNFGITIENTSPYRGDMKGIVERLFRSINSRVKTGLPGAVKKDFRTRGDEDYRLNAKLTLKEFTQIIIKIVIAHNNSIIEKYELTPNMISDGIVPIPTKLWAWGINNRKGSLRKPDYNTFRMSILPKGTATVLRGSIKFKGLYYIATQMIENRLFNKNPIKKVEVAYDPRNIKNIYVFTGIQNEFVVFTLDERSIEYESYLLEDVIEANKQKNELRRQARDHSLKKEIQLDYDINKASKQASKSSGIINSSKKARIKNIRKNRQFEKKKERYIESFKQELEEKEGILLSIDSPEEEKEYMGKSFEKEKIDAISKALWGEDNNE